jgi:hypothetical protein
VPSEWTEDDYNWTTNLPGEGHGSPVIIGERIFLLCGDLYSAGRTVVCINSDDGKILWKKGFKSAPHYLHRDNNYAASTPAADAGGVVSSWTTPKTFIVVALDNDGNEVWKRDLGEYKAAWGGSPSPIIVDDMVIILNEQDDPKYMSMFLPEGTPVTAPGESYAIALDRATGETRWKHDRITQLANYATPCVRELGGGKKEVIFFGAGNGMTAIDPSTGEVNWELRDVFAISVARIVMSSLLAGDLIMGTSGQGSGLEMVAVRPPSGKDDKPEIAFKVTESIPLVPTALYKDDRVYLTCETGYVSCVNATTGEYLWRERIRRSKFNSSPIWADGRLFCVDIRGNVIVLAAGDTFKELGRTSLGDDSRATPAVAHGSMYFRAGTQLLSIGGKK